MATWDDYPEEWAEFDKARKALKPLEAKRDKEMVKLNKVSEDIEKLVDKKYAIRAKADTDREKIIALRAEVARLARAMGAESA